MATTPMRGRTIVITPLPGEPGEPRPSGKPREPEPPAPADFDARIRDYHRARAGRPRSYEPLVPVRPGTVTAAAVILFVSAGLGLLACCGINYLASEARLSDGEQTFLTIFSAVVVGVSILNALLGYFILQGRQWARVTAIVLAAISIVVAVINVVSGGDQGGGDSLSGCIGIAINAVIISLLSGSAASDYFRSMRR